MISASARSVRGPARQTALVAADYSLRSSIRHYSVERFTQLWEQQNSTPNVFRFLAVYGELTAAEKVEVCLIDQLHRWPMGLGLPVERYLENVPEIASDDQLKLKLVVGEFRSRQALKGSSEPAGYVRRFPELGDPLREALASPPEDRDPPVILPPTKTLRPSVQRDARAATRDGSGATDPQPSFDVARGVVLEAAAPLPTKIGRYQVLRVLGDGGFGRVYLAFDDELCRQVAIKVPHRYRIAGPADVEAYLKEARMVAAIDDHAIAIVPVYDCGRTDDGLCFVVSKYIEGSDLATKVKRTPLTYPAAAELVAKVAEALHAAHLKGVVHRDVKPANILIDVQDRSYLADFGIALKEEDYGTGHTTMGTVPYMSPEQLRGEGHLVDGRTDIFSLGVVLYELIAGRRPFPSDRAGRDSSLEPRPPRQINDAIPKELERICLKALSHRVSDRYSTARDLAVDLNDFLKLGTASGPSAPPVAASSGSGLLATSGHLSTAREIPIIPKGLRSFDRDDADFFLELLPGPRDREGIPESVHFWKTRIQETDPDRTFRVGMLYGPSGCGKSSLLKAGVIPRLGEDVISIYVESTAVDTELRLLKALRKDCPDVPCNLGLPETVAALRRGRGGRKKVLVVLDQFEQWLHAQTAIEKSDLVWALRQCDGQHVQCVVSVRDDFWMAVTHFMDALEVALVPGENVAAIDLFSLRHAKKVLTAIGHAYNAVSAVGDGIPAEQKQFINQAVDGLARDDRVIPVHLALFAEMVKNRPWVPATLKEVGGTKGVGVTFLEETFNSPLANPSHRLHQKGARSVLGALLSDKGGSIKGAMRSYDDLLAVSGYQQQPREFESLLRILDSDLRLITPTDPEGLDPDSASAGGSASRPSERYYHLTHDYLVPSLREWLTRKQKETRQGRAELILAERAGIWSVRPTRQTLPSFTEWLAILMYAPRQARTSPTEHKRLLQAAARHYSARIIVAIALLGLASWFAYEYRSRSNATALVESLRTASTQDAPRIIERLIPLRRWADPALKHVAETSDASSPEHLHAAMSLLSNDPSQQAYLTDRLLVAAPSDFVALLDALWKDGNRRALADRLWNELQESDNNASRRFRAGVALVRFDPPNSRVNGTHWQSAFSFLANRLVQELGENPSSFDVWVDQLKPVGQELYPQLKHVLSGKSLIDRHTAALVLCEFVADQPDKIADLVLLAEPREYDVLAPKLIGLGDAGVAALVAELNSPIPLAGPLEGRLRQKEHQARAAVTLLEFSRTEPLIALLSSTSDPDLATYVEDRLSRLGVQPELVHQLVQRVQTGPRAALIRGLGGMSAERIPPGIRESLVATLTQLFKSDPDAGIHSAAEWALRSWGYQELVTGLTKDLETNGPVKDRAWFINRTGHTMVVLRGPIEIKMGSASDEDGRDASDEEQHMRRINRDYAISTMEITAEQFLRYLPGFKHSKKTDYTPTTDCPITMLTWHRAAEYCNWLSKREGIPEDQWCYRTVDHIAKPADDYLERTGYRLPTEVEWECACRAGTTTAFSWGADPRMHPRYAWTIENSHGHNWPVGSLCPNRFGLFDMHGNANEWTQNLYLMKNDGTPVMKTGDDVEDQSFLEDSFRVERGGSSIQFVQYQRCANRTYAKARTNVSAHTGFRIARTLTRANGR